MSTLRQCVAITLCTLAMAGSPDVAVSRAPSGQVIGSVTQFAAGLQFPRGLKFGPDGQLYVAEAGEGPALTPAPAGCELAGPVVRPYTSSATGGRISRIDAAGRRSTVTDSFPRAVNGLGDVLGVADVAFIGTDLYALVASGGCSHAVSSIPSGIAKVLPGGSWSMIADFSAYQRSHPVRSPEAGDYEPDGTWYSMVAVRGALYAVEPNHGELVKVSPDGQISRVVDFSATLGHVVPTAIGEHGVFYVGNLGEFDPDQINRQQILQVTPSGQLRSVATGLSKVLGVAFDAMHRMYVLEMTTDSQFPAPGLGRIVRISNRGEPKLIAAGLSLPTAMTLGPDGNLYVSNWGFGPPGLGEILKVVVPRDD
jgi:hypothetical protein